MLPPCRALGLVPLVVIAFVTLGRAPGAVQLRTREVEILIVAEGKGSRETRARPALIRDPGSTRAT